MLKNMNKILILILLTIILNGCANSLAFLGPASSVAGGGKIAQSAMSSVISYGVKKETGMTPSSMQLLMYKNIILKIKKKNV